VLCDGAPIKRDKTISPQDRWHALRSELDEQGSSEDSAENHPKERA
jgi:hypothetical protein